VSASALAVTENSTMANGQDALRRLAFALAGLPDPSRFEALEKWAGGIGLVLLVVAVIVSKRRTRLSPVVGVFACGLFSVAYSVATAAVGIFLQPRALMDLIASEGLSIAWRIVLPFGPFGLVFGAVTTLIATLAHGFRRRIIAVVSAIVVLAVLLQLVLAPMLGISLSVVVANTELYLTSIALGIVAALSALTFGALERSSPRAIARWGKRPAFLSAALVLSLVMLGIWFAQRQPERVFMSFSEWDSVSLTISDTWTMGEIGSRSTALEFGLADSILNLDLGVGRQHPEPWQPTRLEMGLITRIDGRPLAGGDVRVVYGENLPDQHMRFATPTRICIVGEPSSQGDVTAKLQLKPNAKIRLRQVDEPYDNLAAYLGEQHRKLIRIEMLEGGLKASLAAIGTGVLQLRCGGAVRPAGGESFRLLNAGPAAEEASKHFEPTVFGKVLRFATHPPVIVAIGRRGEEHDVTFSGKVSSLVLDRVTLRLGAEGHRLLNVADVTVRGPSGELHLGRALHSVTPADEVLIGGNDVVIRHSANAVLVIEGHSPYVELNGESLSRSRFTMLPGWLRDNVRSVLTNLVTALVTFALTWFFSKRRRASTS
jgi:hypothetical protein